MSRILTIEWEGLRRVISGGQVGVDQGGLAAAQAFAVETGGWAPRGFRTTEGSNPSLLRDSYGLLEHSAVNYQARTKANVVDSDGTLLIYSKGSSAGTVLTRNLATKLKKPLLEICVSDASYWEGTAKEDGLKVVEWIETNTISVLNVAGNHENPDYHSDVARMIVAAAIVELGMRGKLVQQAERWTCANQDCRYCRNGSVTLRRVNPNFLRPALRCRDCGREMQRTPGTTSLVLPPIDHGQ